jgi:tRNA pseudouridine38-40 synthase
LRFFIQFAYHGKNYFGFQKQPNAISIQETLEKCLTLLLQEPIEIVGAGRTDSGVHAKVMYAHFDCTKTINIPLFIPKLNSFLPTDIACANIFLVKEDAHARFDAISRSYSYYIATTKNVFAQDTSFYCKAKLDLQKMNEACKIMQTHNDFECFSKVHTDVHTFNCKITQAYWEQKEDYLIFHITADRFLRNMVRAIVGTMINVGLHKINLQQFEAILESKNRSKAGFSVPAQGLFLTNIKYPYL